MGKPLEELKIITCHLGNGSSMAAVKYGKSVDTTMGFTPLEGLMMGTRCGDIDPAIPLFIQNAQSCGSEEVNMIFNRMSGIMGISGVSSDMRDIEEAVEQGNERALLALNMFAYRIRKYIGAYIGAMNGCDILVFTAGIGENSAYIRREICRGLSSLLNKFATRILVVPTNEELMIARDTYKLVRK